MQARKIYQAIASRQLAVENCIKSGNDEWRFKHENAIDAIVKEHFPHGSGFDNGTTFDNVRSTAQKLVFNTSFHHMDENGCYDGWTEHSVIIRPDLALSYRMSITGRDRNDIKEYIAQCFASALDSTITE